MALGDCFRWAALRAEGAATVVHGQVYDGRRYLHHAWVEVDGRCLDWQSCVDGGAGWALDAFYARLVPRGVIHYTPEQATILALTHGHWGPWGTR
jgi:hypothetical protein